MSLLNKIGTFLEATFAQLTYKDLLAITRAEVHRAATNLRNVRARALEFREKANHDRLREGMVPVAMVTDVFLDLLARLHTRDGLFEEWVEVLGEDEELGSRGASVRWVREMEDGGFPEGRLLRLLRFWENSKTVCEEFEFLFGSCCHGRYGPGCLEEETYCTLTVHGGMMIYVNKLSPGYFGELLDRNNLSVLREQPQGT